MKAKPVVQEKSKLHPFLMSVGKMLDATVRRTVLDQYESDASHEFRRDKDITIPRAAKVTRAIWALHKAPPADQVETEQTFWRRLGTALTGNNTSLAACRA